MLSFSEIELIKRATEIAHMAHRGQVRKYTQDPYIVHPESVAGIVGCAGGDAGMIAAAWLHDTVEDTYVTYDFIHGAFGHEVATHVWFLTDISKPEDGNREVRKAIDREHIALAPPSTKTVKLADLIDNSSSIVAKDPGFAKIYIEEKRKLLALRVLGLGNTELLIRARSIVNDYDAKNGIKFSWTDPE